MNTPGTSTSRMQGIGPRRVLTCDQLGICQYRQPPCGPGTGCMHSPNCSDAHCPGRPLESAMPAGVLHTCNGGAAGIDTQAAPERLVEFRPGFWLMGTAEAIEADPLQPPRASLLDRPLFWAVLAVACLGATASIGLVGGAAMGAGVTPAEVINLLMGAPK